MHKNTSMDKMKEKKSILWEINNLLALNLIKSCISSNNSVQMEIHSSRGMNEERVGEGKRETLDGAEKKDKTMEAQFW